MHWSLQLYYIEILNGTFKMATWFSKARAITERCHMRHAASRVIETQPIGCHYWGCYCAD